MSGRFDGRVAFVTGAAGAIGSATAQAFARAGARLFLLDLKALDEQAQALTQAGTEVAWRSADVRDAAAVKDAVAQAERRFGRIDVLVNVAGVVSHGAPETVGVEEWDRVLDVNLKSTFLCCQAVMPIMRRQRYGRIVNLGSVVGKNGGNPRPWLDRREAERAGNIAYGVSKAGVHALTFFLAKDLAADGVTVNAVAPGPIATGMTTNLPESLKQLIPVGRMGTVSDVADAILFLAAETSGFVTGEILDLNGGLWMD